MSKYRSTVVCFIIACWCALSSSAAEKLKPEALVAKHLESIGSATVRSQSKARLISGNVRMSILVGGSGTMDGTLAMETEGEKVNIQMKFPDPNYQGEEFVFDGEAVKIGQIRPGVRSRLGIFMESQSQILKEGLLGGVLSTAWPLLDLTDRRAKLKNDGLKKIDGRQLYELGYTPRKGSGDVVIKLYFDPTTFRHVMTVYSLTVSPQMGANEVENARQQETRIRLEEHFDDFKDMNGLTLPTKWLLKLTSEGGISGSTSAPSTSILQWEMGLQEFKTSPTANVTGND